MPTCPEISVPHTNLHPDRPRADPRHLERGYVRRRLGSGYRGSPSAPTACAGGPRREQCTAAQFFIASPAWAATTCRSRPPRPTRTEGNTGTTPFTFTVTRSGDTSGTTTVNYAVTGSGANAANAADFGGTFPSGIVTFADGETSQTITINVPGDTASSRTRASRSRSANASARHADHHRDRHRLDPQNDDVESASTA